MDHHFIHALLNYILRTTRIEVAYPTNQNSH
jgi:hypothetical protein